MAKVVAREEKERENMALYVQLQRITTVLQTFWITVKRRKGQRRVRVLTCHRGRAYSTSRKD